MTFLWRGRGEGSLKVIHNEIVSLSWNILPNQTPKGTQKNHTIIFKQHIPMVFVLEDFIKGKDVFI